MLKIIFLALLFMLTPACGLSSEGSPDPLT